MRVEPVGVFIKQRAHVIIGGARGRGPMAARGQAQLRAQHPCGISRGGARPRLRGLPVLAQRRKAVAQREQGRRPVRRALQRLFEKVARGGVVALSRCGLRPGETAVGENVP